MITNSCLLFVFPGTTRIILFPYCTGYQNYTSVHIAGAVQCYNKHLSKLWASILTAIKMGLQGYHDTSRSISGINKQNSRSQFFCESIKTFYFSTLYTTIPHAQLKSRLKQIIQHCFSKKNLEQSPTVSYYR